MPPATDRIGDIARPVEPVAGATLAIDAERIFARRPSLTSLVVTRSDGEQLILTRRSFMSEMSGRLGYGRALHHRSPIEHLIDGGESLTVPAHTSLADAAAAALDRPEGCRYDDIVVHFDDDGIGLLTVADLLSELSHANGYRALHDPLTRLPNRALFFDVLRRVRESASSPATTLAVLFLDLDRFKAINDSLGHEAGDQVLLALAQRLRATLRGGDLIARLGGDEFGVLIKDASESSVYATALRLQAAASQPLILQAGNTVTITASVGIATYGGSGPADGLVRDADLAMYRAKRSGGGAIALYEPDMHASALAGLTIESHLRGAADRGEMALVYQPMVDLGSGATIACEALLRWTHPELGVVAPAQFIPVAERSGEIRELGRWVLETACDEAVRWPVPENVASPLLIGINVAVRQLVEPEFTASVADILRRTGLPAERLVIEVTESALMEEGSGALVALSELSELGAKIVLDDFGTGYSSLSYLQRLPIYAVKIDKSFIDELRGANASMGSPIIRAVLGMAGGLGLNVVAEGVETPEQVAALRSLGCPLAQGYHFARPMAADQMRQLLARPASPRVDAT